MEIERKYLIDSTQIDYKAYPSHRLEQGYLSVNPVVRVRRQDDDYYLTYKGKGLLVREEYNLPLTKESYEHLLQKADGNVISKRRYLIPYGKFTVELDEFDPPFAPLLLAEVEFASLEEAEAFIPPQWFVKEVTDDSNYQNSTMSRRQF